MPSLEFFLIALQVFSYLVIGIIYFSVYFPVINRLMDDKVDGTWKTRVYVFLAIWVALGVAVLLAALIVYSPEPTPDVDPTVTSVPME